MSAGLGSCSGGVSAADPRFQRVGEVVDVVDHEPGPGQGATDYRQEVDQDADSFVTVAGSVAAASTEPAPTLAAAANGPITSARRTPSCHTSSG